MLLVRRGLQNRAIRSTEYNAESSRSHTILQLFFQIEDRNSDGSHNHRNESKSKQKFDAFFVTFESGVTVIKKSVLSLVDLAGSEKWRSSLSTSGGANADQYEHEQRQLTIQKEMTNINNSLTVLGS